MKPIYKTLLLAGGTMLLGAANVWAAASGVAAIDTPSQAGINIIQNGIAPFGGAVGGLAGGYEMIYGNHPKSGLAIAGFSLIGAVVVHNGTVMSGAFGGATAALIHIVPHAHIIASAVTRLFA